MAPRRRPERPASVNAPAPGRSGGRAAPLAGLLVPAAAALLALAPAGAEGQEEAPLEEGSYRITVAGQAVGTEAFAVRREGREVRAVGRVQLDTAVDVLTSLEVWLQTDTDFRPSLFRLRPQGPGPSTYTAVREGDRVRIRTTAAEGERYREFLAPDGLALFDPRIAHHWFLVLRSRADELADGPVQVPAVLPARGEQLRLEVRRFGEEEVLVAGRRVTATRHEVTGGLTATVWTGEGGRVLRLSLPSLVLTAERIRDEEEGT